MVFEMLSSVKSKGRMDYCLPKVWLEGWYRGPSRVEGEKVFVDPAVFYSYLRKWLEENKIFDAKVGESLSLQRGESSREWIKRAVLYSSLVRTNSAYNHKGFGRFEQDDVLGYRESGTFLKMTALLPHLKKLGVNTLYLLPITESSDVFKKGEVGSPYAVKDFLRIDRRYHDPLLEGWHLEDEFKAFVQACHMVGIRVVLDFIPRTAARDCNLILSHPEWFYWVKLEALSSYAPPKIEKLGFCQPTFEQMRDLYDLPNVRAHLDKFSQDPSKLNPQKWHNFVKDCREENLIYEIAKHFGVITAPGFSDWVNDPQPTWDDVTFLRLYLDHPITARGKVGEEQPPYVLFDVIKASRFPGEKSNSELWEYIASILPQFQKKYGVDGVRLDMGHALPAELQQMIMSNARRIDPAFVFIAEELEPHRAAEAAKAGYDVVVGNSWWMLPRFPDKTYEFFQTLSCNMVLPFLAAAETPDTPRVAVRREAQRLKYLLPFLCAFSKNGVMTLNCGQEIEETQPMNLGLDNDACGRFTLGCDDEFQGKLAFFDHYVLHWHRTDLIDFLSELIGIRNQFLDLITDGQYKPVYLSWQDGTICNASYWTHDTALIVLANLKTTASNVSVLLDRTLGEEIEVEKVHSWDGAGWKQENVSMKLDCELPQLGFKLYILKFRRVNEV
ncbi:alpha-amylase family glycosyl hydrolase [Pseudothermotoga sp.]